MLNLIGLPIYSQSNFIQTFPSTVNQHIAAVVSDTTTNNYYVAGSKADSSLVIKFDSNNNILWSKILNTNYLNQIQSIITSIALTGDTLVGCGFTQSATNDFDGGFIFKMNATTGNLYWFKGEISSDTYFSSILIDNNQYILTGANRTSFPNTNCDFIAVSASNGSINWQSNQLDLYFSTSNINHVDDIANSTKIRDGYFYVTGRAYVAINNNMRAFVIKMSTTGQVIWMKYLMYNETGSSFKRFYGLEIDLAPNNRIIVAVTGDATCSGSCNNFQMGLVEMDTSGSVIWSKLYDLPSSSGEFIRHVEIIDSGYRVFGISNVNSTMGKSLIAFETNSTGTITVSTVISKPDYNFEMNLLNYANVTGEGWSKNSETILGFSIKNTVGVPINQMVVLKTNGLSNLVSDCFTITPVTITSTVVPPYSNNLQRDESSHPVNFNLTTTVSNTIVNNPCPIFNFEIEVVDSSCTSYTLGAQVPLSYSILWSTGETTSTILISTAGQYTLEVYNPATCCYYFDTINVVFSSSLIDINFVNPGVLCLASGDTFTLSPIIDYYGTANLSYLWSTGSTNLSTEAQFSGWYSIEVTDGCEVSSDSIYISVLNPPQAQLDAIYTICEGGTVNISPVINGAASIQWSDGSIGDSLSINSIGQYSLIVSNVCFSDTIDFEVVTGEPVSISLPMDIDTCLSNGTILITPTFVGSGEMLWSTGQTFEEINVSTSGLYWVQYDNGCYFDSDSINIVIDENIPLVISANVNDPACELTLNLSVIGCDATSLVTWNTGNEGCDLFVDQPGVYIVNYSNVCGSFADTLVIENLGDGGLYVPNTFTPNGDEFNNDFRIFLGECYDSYVFKFEVYNRWGELIFESTTSDFVWDGTYKGKICQDGTYTWKINLKKTNTDEKEELTGHLNIIK